MPPTNSHNTRNAPDRANDDDGRDPSANPSVAFRDIVQRDPTICNNCFRRTHDTESTDRYSGIWGWYTIEYWTPVPHRTRHAYHRTMTYGTTTACECGEIEGGKRRPVPFPVACEYGEHLLTTLEEKNIGVDPDAFRATLRERKRDPDMQGREDDGVFAAAVEAGLRAANPPR